VHLAASLWTSIDRERGVGENREGPSEIDEVTVGGHTRLEHMAASGSLSVDDTGSRKWRRKEERERVRDEWEGVTARESDSGRFSAKCPRNQNFVFLVDKYFGTLGVLCDKFERV
jgi:hypothetical protein